MKAKFLLLAIIYALGIYAQDSQTNLQKYWVYRERLKNFVTVGDCQGCSLPASKRGGSNSGEVNRISYPDETCRLGLYIGLLACEYKLLKNTGDPFLAQTKKELFFALQAFNRLDHSAEAWLKYSTD